MSTDSATSRRKTFSPLLKSRPGTPLTHAVVAL